MGGKKSKVVNKPTSPPLPTILLLGFEGSGKTVFIRSLASYTQQDIYKSEKLEILITNRCIDAFASLLNEMNDQVREEVFRISSDDSLEIQNVKKVLGSPTPNVTWFNILKGFSDNYLLFVELWKSTVQVREFAKERIFSNSHNNWTNFANYDKFFSLLDRGRISTDLLKYMSQKRERISDLKINPTGEVYNLVDVKNRLSSVTENRWRRFSELAQTARFGPKTALMRVLMKCTNQLSYLKRF
ncbi:predicted protein [Naegleria gruberi]|uniref:Predicted protein n=1 Tax=Naegleria gruberi TaxID=5762 RepID=D2W2R9_NAEGR|nr:uncharacterized protein NAEGRDRAFT_75690 [Naegleria gruberi]EFC36693.1 predicted protein [Naegleria gruberi]|eukprot:XP_002669437.1 predicted protein [Naegleria gruberi strain NEG-M]